jgi:hypothetical protein
MPSFRNKVPSFGLPCSKTKKRKVSVQVETVEEDTWILTPPPPLSNHTARKKELASRTYPSPSFDGSSDGQYTDGDSGSFGGFSG